MRRLYTIFALFIALSASAQTEETDSVALIERVPEKTIVEMYMDSLLSYRHQLDSLKAVNDYLNRQNTSRYSTKSQDSRYMRLFTPMQFHNDLAHRHFSLNGDDALTTDDQMLIDNALMYIYIHHPELVDIRKPIKASSASDGKSERKIIDISKDMAGVNVPKAQEIEIEPVKIVVTKPNFWTFSGDYYLQVMQNYYSANWYQGGESNYSALGRIILQANYNNKQKVKWENKLEMELGMRTNKNDTIHGVKTSSDILRYTGKLGLQATKKWYYTLQVVANTQFMRSFATNSHTVNSDFLSPFNLNVSLGMDYTIGWFKNKLTGSVHLAPFACNFKYVDRLALATRNGIEEGKHSIFDFGSTFTIDTNWKISNSVSWRNRLYGYTTYKRMDLQWENTFDLKISKYITASIYIYPRFDDSNIKRKDEKLGYFQVKEYTSLGLKYSF